jgi:hypothetical protein
MSKNLLSEKGSRRNLECLGLLPEVSRAATYVQRQELGSRAKLINT